MKIISAMDSMKGSLTSIEANRIIKEVFQDEQIEVVEIAIADGGEGTVEVFVENGQGVYETVAVHNLKGEAIETVFGWLAESKTAIIEAAAAAGIQFLDFKEATHPKNTSSIGVGETILKALDKQAETIIIGLGGSGTVDGGIGALAALGVRFYDNQGAELTPVGKNLANISSINEDKLDSRVKETTFIVAADVASTLTGPDGAVYMFGLQKGILEEELSAYERAMEQFKSILLENEVDHFGDGAAGGLGAAFRKVLSAEVVSGLELIAKQVQLETLLKDTDLVVTGEGKLDNQTLQGKVPVGISRLSKQRGIPTIAFVGAFTGDSEAFKKVGIHAVIPIVDRITTLEEAMGNAGENLKRAAQRTKELLFLLNSID
ncbi:glycerate kinase [Carnobacterium funditum]|uniref:glycerate kinase n=1 Tax=Carnobacterium funditum TaxID=2752 RepID=UPI0005531DE7|nr:glycerate kinase [Carnobacterium funditum]